MELVLIRNFGWSLYEIEATNAASLIDLTHRMAGPQESRTTYIDDVIGIL